MGKLSEAQIEDRVAIIWGVDEQACQRCGAAIPDGTADDPTWFVDSVIAGRDDAGEPVVHAQILCPKCW